MVSLVLQCTYFHTIMYTLYVVVIFVIFLKLFIFLYFAHCFKHLDYKGSKNCMHVFKYKLKSILYMKNLFVLQIFWQNS